MAKALEINKGERFGRWVIIEESQSHRQQNGKLVRTFSCLCDCGNKANVALSSLRTGRSVSCGCYMKEVNAKRIGKSSITHGNTILKGNEYKSLFFVWNSIKQRCYNPNSDRYHVYGGKGIKICDEWINNFSKFRDWSIENGYFKQPKDTLFKDKLSIDRKNSEGDYTPENCRWISVSENSKRRHLKNEKLENKKIN
jgi:hypothetical protein